MNAETEARKFLDEEEIARRIESYRGKLPSVILEEILESLKGKKITEEQFEKILEKAVNRFKGISGSKLDDVYEKISSLERLITKVLTTSKEEKEISGEALTEEVRSESKEGTVNNSENLDSITSSKLLKIPESPRETILLLKWLEFLLTKAGYDGLEEVLGYYVDIGWISEEVMFQMIKYARGIKASQIPEREDGLMTTQDHIISLLFIEALKNGKIREEELFAIEREVQKIKKEASQIYGV